LTGIQSQDKINGTFQLAASARRGMSAFRLDWSSFLCWKGLLMSSSKFLKDLPAALLAVLCLSVGGCGKDVSEIASSVKDAATQGLEKARETAGDVAQSVSETAKSTAGAVGETMGMAGSFDLTVGQALKTDACYARCIVLGADRPAVLQLQSYQDAEKESFPAVFRRAQVTATDAAALAGQTVEAQLFVKRQANEDTLYTRDAPVQLKVNAIEEGLLVGEIVSGSLATAGSSETMAVSGSFRAVIQ